MDYRKTAERMKCNALDWQIDSQYRKDFNDSYFAITDLLSRAEAAEAAQETLQRTLAEYKARAEKAEAERDRVISALQNLRDSVSTAISEYEQKQKEKYGKKEG